MKRFLIVYKNFLNRPHSRARAHAEFVLRFNRSVELFLPESGHMDGLGSADILEFGHFRFDRREHSLYRLDQTGKAALIPLGRTAIEVLDMLVSTRGELVEREKIMQTVWRGKTVEDSNLAVQISNLRDSIGRRSIQTVSGRGYRFVAPIKQPAPNPRPADPVPLQAVTHPRLSIVVLPFSDLSEDREQRYLADGITDDLTTDLSRIRDLLVISRQTAFTYRERLANSKQIAHELGIRYVLEGSARRSGPRVRVNVQLIDAEADAHVWAERFDRDLSDLFELQDEITTAIAGAIEPQLLRFERDRVASQPRHSKDVYELYQRGMWHHYRHSKADNAEAQHLFRAALAIKPDYPQAMAALALAVCNAGYLCWADDAERNLREAYDLALRAVDLDPLYPMAHFALGLAAMHTHRFDRAMEALKEAVHLNPSFAAAHVILGQMYTYDGRPAEAIPLAEKGIRLSPSDPRLFIWLPVLAGAYYQLGNYEQAVEIGGRSWMLNRNWPVGLRYVVAGLAQLGRRDEARAAAADLESLGHDPALLESLTRSLFRHRPSAEHILEGLRKAGYGGPSIA
jgi:TolB-like protein